MIIAIIIIALIVLAVILISDNGGITKVGSTEEIISTTDSFVGYYADVDADGTVDGVIYADLLIGGSGQWNDNYGIWQTTAISNSKDYYVIKKNYTGVFGKADVLAPTGSGEDRFYVMALEDVNTGTLYNWYTAAEGSLDKIIKGYANDFGKGRTNTEYVMTKWNAGEWGAQNSDKNLLDLWGIIKTEYNNEWFVPSKSEWACFGNVFDITSSNYDDYELSSWYWSSSQYSSSYAFIVSFIDNKIRYNGVKWADYIRLSTTF